MKKTLLIVGCVVGIQTSSHAFIAAAAEAAEKAREEAYRQFMMLKAVQQLKALVNDYETSKRFYEMVKKMNEGREILPLIKDRVSDIGQEMADKLRSQMGDDWIYTFKTNMKPEVAEKKMEDYTKGKIEYAKKMFELSREAEIQAAKISVESNSLDPKVIQKTGLKAQGLQLQLTAGLIGSISQLLDVGTKLFQLKVDEEVQLVQEKDAFKKSTETLSAILNKFK